MSRRQTSKRTPTTDETEPPNIPISNDDLLEKIASIEEEVHRRFDEIDRELDILKTNSEKIQKNESRDDQRFLKLCHAVDYLLERGDHDYDTLACREMILSLLGQKTVRPFSGRTIRNRQLGRKMKRWCLFVAAVLLF